MNEGQAGLPDPVPTETQCGFVALIGAPNAGKSTLVNQLVGAKVSIVTHKVQTTRARLRGIVMHGAAQIVLVDTPGIFTPKRRLDRAMVEAAWQGAREADLVAVLIDAQRGIDEGAEKIIDQATTLGAKKILVINKIDTVAKQALLAVADNAAERLSPDAVFMISALDGDGCDALRDYLAESVPKGPWHYPEDQVADAPLRYTAAEITREKLTMRLHQELPYAATVETSEWKRLKNGSVRIEQTIFVERESQRKIVLGKNGRAIKQMSIEARKEISELVEEPVHLFLFVKVRSAWADDPARYREMGLDFPTG